MNFTEALKEVLKHEGGYVNHPNDPGGETNFGITVAVARENGYTGDMRTIPASVVADIYKRKYWDKVRADQMPESVRYALFDYAVNSGVSAAVRALQRVCGVADDGIIGPKTIAAASTYHGHLGAALCGHRLQFMADLRTWGTFGKGWARRIALIMQKL
jgi:lysozyme family protein